MGLFKKKKTKLDDLQYSERTDNRSLSAFDTLSFYLRILTDFISKGNSDDNKPSDEEGLIEGEFFYGSNKIYSPYGVKRMYFLKEFPMSIARGVIDDLRETVDDAVTDYNMQFGTEYKVSVNFVSINDFYDFDLTNRRLQGRWKYLAKQYEKLERARQDRDLEDELQSDKYTDAVRRKVESYLYMKEAKEVRKSAFYKSVPIIEAVCYGSPRTVDEILNIVENRIEEFCHEENITKKTVFLQANEYQKTYTPVVSPDRESPLKKFHDGDVWTEDTISSFTIAQHGVVGDEQGVYHGIDIIGRRPVTFDIYSGEKANNILLTGGTGSGKSGYAKMLVTFMAIDPLFDVVIFDYEGHEYDALVNVFDMTSIGFSSDDGNYINTMVIADKVGDRKIDKNRMIDARESTEKVFHILFTDDSDKTGMRSGMNQEELTIFSSLLSRTWYKFGVTDNEETWSKSKGITYFHMYDTLISMINGTEGKEDIEIMGGREALLDFQRVLMPYFSSTGSRNHWFKHPISVQEVIDAPNVRFSFGMQGKDETSELQQQVALNQMFASQLTLLKGMKNKVEGKKTVTFIEEMQRYINQLHSKDIIAKLISGGRKTGLVNYLITNSPNELILESKLGGTKDNKVSQIMAGITTQIIGASNEMNMNALIETFNLENASGYLYELVGVYNSINQARKSKDVTHPLEYCFFVNRGGQSTVVKMLMHPKLASTPLYETVGTGDISQLRKSTSMNKGKLRTRIKESYDEDENMLQNGGYRELGKENKVPDKFLSQDLQDRAIENENRKRNHVEKGEIDLYR